MYCARTQHDDACGARTKDLSIRSPLGSTTIALPFIRFRTKLYRHIVRIPMGTKCVPLVADLLLYCYERVFMYSLKHENKAGVIEAFNSISRYLDEFLNIDGPYFERTVSQIYPPELKLNKPIPQIPKPPY